MANGIPSGGRAVEPALIYDAGERRTHAEHAAEAYDFARRADAFTQHAQHFRIMAQDFEAIQAARIASESRDRAQWHATMAVYEALRAGIVTRTTA